MLFTVDLRGLADLGGLSLVQADQLLTVFLEGFLDVRRSVGRSDRIVLVGDVQRQNRQRAPGKPYFAVFSAFRIWFSRLASIFNLC